MQLIIWILIIFNGLLLISLITFGILFVLRRRTTLIVIRPDKTIHNKSIFGSVGKTEQVGDGHYFIDDKCIVRTFWGYKLYYFYGNPNPINFDFDKNTPHDIGTKAQDFKSWHETDLINKLFALDSLENLILYLVIGSCILSLATLVVVFTKGQPQVTLAHNMNNTQLIIDAVKVAIRGG